MTPLLALDSVSLRFPRRGWFGVPPEPILSGVDLEVRRGEVLVLWGRSGSGKSTLARLMTGLLTPTSGHVMLEGRPLAALPRRAVCRQVQIVLQDTRGALDARMRVGAQIEEALIVHGVADRARRREEALHSVGLSPEHGTRYPHELSGGQRQRAVLARALVLQPSLLVCDEPVSSLDLTVQARIVALLMDLNRRGLTIVFISHDWQLCQRIADRIVGVENGRLTDAVADGTQRLAPARRSNMAV